MKKKHLDAIKLLEAALLVCKQSGLALVGIDSDIYATVVDAAFKAECRSLSSCEAVLNRNNTDHAGTTSIDTSGSTWTAAPLKVDIFLGSSMNNGSAHE